MFPEIYARKSEDRWENRKRFHENVFRWMLGIQLFIFYAVEKQKIFVFYRNIQVYVFCFCFCSCWVHIGIRSLLHSSLNKYFNMLCLGILEENDIFRYFKKKCICLIIDFFLYSKEYLKYMFDLYYFFRNICYIIKISFLY